MVAIRTNGVRIPHKVKANWLRNYAFQLDFFTEISETVGNTGTPVLFAPTPPNHNGGVHSAMISPNPTASVTYPQDWSKYNLAQQTEKQRFLVLLRDLCSTVPQPPQTNGRPRLPLADMLFAATFKVYSGFSSRRFTSDVQAAMQGGLIDRAPHFNSTNRYLADPALNPLLKTLIEVSASPLQAVEVDFAIDSTGFATSNYARWFDHKWGKSKSKQRFVKTHLMTGVKTNIVTAAEATANESADAPQLPDLLAATTRIFEVQELSADKAYSSKRNLRAVEAAGGTPYIPYKVNATGRQGHHRFDGLWSRMWHYYNFNRDEFMAHYHKRSNAETTMAMIKSKFGGAVKSKSPTAQVNEVLCKVLAHNICVLIQSFYELGIESAFSPAIQPEPKVIDLNQYRLRMGL